MYSSLLLCPSLFENVSTTKTKNKKQKLSLADIKTGSIIEHLVRLCGDAPQISEELTPSIWAVKKHLDTIPAYAEWTASAQYQQFTGANIGFFGF